MGKRFNATDQTVLEALRLQKGRGSKLGGMTKLRNQMQGVGQKAGKFVVKHGRKTAMYGGIGVAGAFGVAGIAATGMKGLTNIMTKTMRGILPNTYYPAASGRFGTRTASQAGPAGIEGLKFNFRRR